MGTLLGLCVLAFIGYLVLCFVSIKLEDAASDRDRKRELEASRVALEDFREEAANVLGRAPTVVEGVRLAETNGSYTDTHYAAIDDALYFGLPILALWKRAEIKGSRMFSTFENRTEYVVELRLYDLHQPLEEVHFLHKSEADDFFERVGLVGQLS